MYVPILSSYSLVCIHVAVKLHLSLVAAGGMLRHMAQQTVTHTL